MLSAYADGELEISERQVVCEHLSSCPNCSSTLDKIITLKQALNQVLVIPEGFDASPALAGKLDALAREFGRDREESQAPVSSWLSPLRYIKELVKLKAYITGHEDDQNVNNAEASKISQGTPGQRPKRIKLALIILGVLVVVGISGSFALSQLGGKKAAESLKEIAGRAYQPAIALASGFASYEEVPVNISPKISAYTVDKDLANVVNAKDFEFSDSTKELLAKNGFVVGSSYSDEFFPIYESNRYNLIPNFITTDSILHNYHLMFDHLLRSLEKEKLASELKTLNASMLSLALKQYSSLKGTEWESAAKRNVGFFAVASKLLDPAVEVPAIVKNEVEQELALIAAHRGIAESPVMNTGKGSESEQLEPLKEDYSQYIPRGHYEKTELLKAYFKSMMWYGRLTFRVYSEDEVRSAVLITLALNEESNLMNWNRIYEPTNFFVGKSDDITYYQFRDLLEKVYGKRLTLQTVVGDKGKFASLLELSKKLEPPQINSIPISLGSDREKEIKGFRFMGQRFTIDAAIFQRLVEREVPGRMLPKGLDIPAAMGSDEALNILESMGETKYENYSENMAKMKEYISRLDTKIWTQNLYWGWLYSLIPLTKEKPEGYPIFMRNQAWVRKELNTYLGSWTELKHDTILYAKQVYAEMGGGSEKKDDRGYVEPNPYVYARLASLLKMTRDGLQTRGLLSEKNKENLGRMERLALSLKTISEKELNGVPLTDEEYELIRSYGGQLEHFWLEAFRDEGIKSIRQIDDKPAAIIADVATDPYDGRVLEEGTGYIYEIFVVVPVDGTLRITKGGVYSYYEFPWPMSDRLTDSKWREMLNSGKAPRLPEWTDEFIAR
ncbi:MAG: DUF3160 domain-containing protein [Actinobacteria bacterium]|nr:DUF3160 domain-containing protein [Actinomycetota bacterium]